VIPPCRKFDSTGKRSTEKGGGASCGSAVDLKGDGPQRPWELLGKKICTERKWRGGGKGSREKKGGGGSTLFHMKLARSAGGKLSTRGGGGRGGTPDCFKGGRGKVSLTMAPLSLLKGEKKLMFWRKKGKTTGSWVLKQLFFSGGNR